MSQINTAMRSVITPVPSLIDTNSDVGLKTHSANQIRGTEQTDTIFIRTFSSLVKTLFYVEITSKSNSGNQFDPKKFLYLLHFLLRSLLAAEPSCSYSLIYASWNHCLSSPAQHRPLCLLKLFVCCIIQMALHTNTTKLWFTGLAICKTQAFIIAIKSRMATSSILNCNINFKLIELILW